MPSATASPLGHVLLGLLLQRPQSGYDLRRAFAETPLRHFSDSPGAIYPALRRLKGASLIASTVDRTHPRRPREVYTVTSKGKDALRAWLAVRPTAADLERDVGGQVLRFVFIPPVLGRRAGLRFLAELERLLAQHVAALTSYHRASLASMPLAGRLGLENGIAAFTTHLTWCRKAQVALRRADRRES